MSGQLDDEFGVRRVLAHRVTLGGVHVIELSAGVRKSLVDSKLPTLQDVNFDTPRQTIELFANRYWERTAAGLRHEAAGSHR